MAASSVLLVTTHITWGKIQFPNVQFTSDLTFKEFQDQIYSRTRILPHQQKVFSKRGPVNDRTWASVVHHLSQGDNKLMLIGTPSTETQELLPPFGSTQNLAEQTQHNTRIQRVIPIEERSTGSHTGDDRSPKLVISEHPTYATQHVNALTSKYQPLMDVGESEREIEISWEVPGVDPQVLQLTFHQNSLCLSGSKNSCLFQRKIPLAAAEVDIQLATTQLKDGVLTLKIPKKPMQSLEDVLKH